MSLYSLFRLLLVLLLYFLLTCFRCLLFFAPSEDGAREHEDYQPVGGGGEGPGADVQTDGTVTPVYHLGTGGELRISH